MVVKVMDAGGFDGGWRAIFHSEVTGGWSHAAGVRSRSWDKRGARKNWGYE